MRWKETLYRRHLKRPIDAEARTAIHNEFARRKHQVPILTELHWHAEKPQFTIRSKWMSVVVNFTDLLLVVDIELSLTAKMLATEENRNRAVQIIESIADDLGL
jgi:hypothetical protein